MAQIAGVCTAADYASIIGALVEAWKIAGLKGLSDAAADAQEFLGGLSARYQKLAERIQFTGLERPRWIYDWQISLGSFACAFCISPKRAPGRRKLWVGLYPIAQGGRTA